MYIIPKSLEARPPHRLAPWRATAVLVALLAVGWYVLQYRQHASQRISVDVLDLLPRDEQDPTIRLARQTVSGRFGRTLLIALSDPAHPDKAPTAAAADIAAELAVNPAFSGVFVGLTPDAKDRLQEWFFSHRIDLRLPVWFDGMTARWRKEKGASAPADPDPAWLAAAAAADLQDFQTTPEAEIYQPRLPSDPLLLVPGLLSAFGEEDKSTAGSVAGGALTRQGPDGVQYALIQAETRFSQMEAMGQKPVFDALDTALQHARNKAGPGLTMRFTGVNKFASETREHGLREIQLLTYISLGLSFVLLLVAFRSVVVFVYLLLPIVTATVWSLVICFALFDRVHVVAITFTTVLVGVALDYGIYTLIHARRTAGGLAQALRDIRLPLVAGCLTSVGGFVFMTLTNLPMLQQMGLAVALGLVFALALDFLYLPWINWKSEVGSGNAEVKAEGGKMQEAENGEKGAEGQRLMLVGVRFPAMALGSVAVAAALVFVARIHWSDDIQTLSTMSPKLLDEQTFLRGLFGQGNRQHIVLTFGKDLNEAFAHLDKLNATLASEGTRPGDRFLNLGKLLPTQEQISRCHDYFRAHPDFAANLRDALGKDFNADAFAPFWEDWKTWLAANNSGPVATPARLIAGLRAVLPLPLQNLWNEEQSGTAWLATTVSDGLYNRLPASALSAPNTPIDQVKTINGALRRYRLMASRQAGIGLAIIVLAVVGIYGWRHGLFMLVIPTLSLLVALAVLGFMGQTLGLLHVVALLLGFCLASDYSIFLGSPGELPHSTRRAILLAATTALLSFGVLSFSKIEALKDICLTVTLVIACVLVLCEVSYRVFVSRMTNDEKRNRVERSDTEKMSVYDHL